ncbi:hypothetical protein O3M35_012985 [Rhynocoris fuscipes]|uniref:UBX domain-containing protein n=1 Tax=Rhynocoris fuscipes TaxID=488301 RepID=A0AAW1CFF0_9HEMI
MFSHQENVMDIDEDSNQTMLVLKIYDESKNKEYRLSLPGHTTVGQVKRDTYTLTGIPVLRQVWCGWPDLVRDSSILEHLGLDEPFHSLTVSPEITEPSAIPPNVFIDLAETDSSHEDFEDAAENFAVDDEMFAASTSNRNAPLIPNDVEDETAGSVHFIDGFTYRYGENTPNFFPGPLEDAINEACMKPAKERRMLGIYLHHDGSVLTNVFCTEVLGSESVLQMFTNNFVLWGWDLTNTENRNMFLASALKSLGGPVADTVRKITVTELPALLIIIRSRSNTELFNVINGNIGINEFMTLLIHAVDVHTQMLETEIKEDELRAARERIKIEQDQAFQQSLQADRAKEEARRKQQLEQSKEEERIRVAQEAESKRREDERLQIQSELPDEPSEGCGEGTIKIRFRPPKSAPFERRFLANDKLKLLFNFLLVNGYRIEDYKVISSWPRRDLTTCDQNNTLDQVKLHPQETLILEER